MKTVSSVVILGRRVLLIDLSIFAGMGLVCWLIGAHTLRQYSLGLILAGGVCWIVGLTTVIGGGGVSMSLRDTDLPAGPSPKATIYQRVDRWLTGPVSSLGFMLTMVAAGLVPLAAGWTMVTLLRR